MTKHKCFISCKKEDEYYKNIVQKLLQYTAIDKSLDEPIKSNNPDYIMAAIRKIYLADSTDTIFLIGSRSSEALGYEEQKYIIGELHLTLNSGKENNRGGLSGVVLPPMVNVINNPAKYMICTEHNRKFSYPNLNDETVIREFNYNFTMNNSYKCFCQQEERERYAVLISWHKFVQIPYYYIDWVFQQKYSDALKS